MRLCDMAPFVASWKNVSGSFQTNLTDPLMSLNEISCKLLRFEKGPYLRWGDSLDLVNA